MSFTLYGYPKCSTCRKAQRWLDDNQHDYTFVDLVAHPPTAQTLQDLWERSGLEIKRFFNTSGQSYRQNNWKEKFPKTSQADALAALAADGKLIKRPILDTGSAVLVGFREAAYQDALSP